MRGAAGTMASAGGGSLGFLAWLLLFRTRLTEAQEAGAGAQGEATPPSSSPLRSGGGDEDPRASWWETLPGGGRGFPAPQQLGKNKSQSSLLAFNSDCGGSLVKIVGGMDTEEGKWPWQVSVRFRGLHVCGGSLIAAQWVLTAAHCILSVKMGDRSIHNQNTSLVMPVRKIIVHSLFRRARTVKNDIALLHLLQPVNFTSAIQSVCIPSEILWVEAGTNCWVTGWGKTSQGGDSYNAHAKRRDTASAGDSTPGTMISGCGHRILRIVGGAPAPERKWPWQVSLQVNDKHVCGGSLIAHQWVLTAGHCIFGFMEYTVKLGDIDVNHQSNMAVVVPVRDIVMHHDYSSRGTISDDIALALLDFPVNYSTHIQPVCLPEKTFLVPDGTTCWVTGWGKLEETDKPDKAPKMLQEADLTIMRYKECNRLLKRLMKAKNDVVRKGAVCGYSDKGKDSCQGDSGGPLVCEYNETWIQVGIVSWGVGCGHEGYPGVYTEVSFYVDWVKRHMNQASCLDSTAFLVLLLCLVLPLGS